MAELQDNEKIIERLWRAGVSASRIAERGAISRGFTVRYVEKVIADLERRFPKAAREA